MKNNNAQQLTLASNDLALLVALPQPRRSDDALVLPRAARLALAAQLERLEQQLHDIGDSLDTASARP